MTQNLETKIYQTPHPCKSVSESVDSRVYETESEFDKKYLFKEKIMTFEQRAAYRTGMYLKNTIKEKIDLITNPKKCWHELKDLAIKEGVPFAVYAATVEICEDVITPIILAKTGYAEYIPIVLIGHSEPFMYPIYFGVRKAYRTIKAKNPNKINKANSDKKQIIELTKNQKPVTKMAA